MGVGDRPVFTVLGGGLAGPLLAVSLGRLGYPVDLYEMRPDPRTAGGGGGRSINLALSERGLVALAAVGLREAAESLCIPMRGRMMHAPTGALAFQPYSTEADRTLNSISRSRLNAMLLDAAASCPGVRVFFDRRCLRVDLDRNRAEFQDTRSGEVHAVDTDILVGADGAFSRLRAALMQRARFDYRQDYLEYGYKELSLPPAPGGGFALEPHALHIWPRGRYMMIALPNTDATFTCTLFWPYEGNPGFSSIRTGEDATAFFRETFPDAFSLMPELAAEFEANPVGSLVTVRCRPWRAGGRAVLIGDAAHAVVPFYGQGMNASFEDCTVLTDCIRARAPDWDGVFAEYEARRKPNTDALADLAVENFVEMRDKVGSRVFLHRKKAERMLHRLFPRWYLPLYSMVTFSSIPYAQARARARRQDRIVLGGLAVLLALLLVALLGALLG